MRNEEKAKRGARDGTGPKLAGLRTKALAPNPSTRWGGERQRMIDGPWTGMAMDPRTALGSFSDRFPARPSGFSLDLGWTVHHRRLELL